MYIAENEIKRIFTSGRNWNLAKQYYNNSGSSLVRSFYISEGPTYYCDAEIYAHNYSSEVSLVFDAQGYISSFDCDCVYCDKDLSACAHVGIFLLFLSTITPPYLPYSLNHQRCAKTEYSSYLIKEITRAGLALINKFQKANYFLIDQEIDHDLINIKTTAKISRNHLALTFSLGNEKYYVIKNTQSFIDAINNNIEYKYGAKLSFFHHLDAFNKDSQAIIHFMNTYLYSQFSQEYTHYYDPKTILLSKANIDDFYNIYINIDKDAINLEIYTEDLTKLNISAYYNEIKLYVISTNYDDGLFIQGYKHWYLYQNNILYRFDEKLSSACSALIISMLEQDNKIYIEGSNIKDFCTYVLGELKEYLDINNDILDKFIAPTMELETFIDLDEAGNIVVLPTYHDINNNVKYIYTNNFIDNNLTAKFNYITDKYHGIIDKELHNTTIDFNSDEYTDFLTTGVGLLTKYSTVLVSNAIKSIKHQRKMNFSVGIRVENNLLFMDISSLAIPPEEIAAVLANYKKKKKYHRLKNGEVINLENSEIDEISDLLENINASEKSMYNGELQIDAYRALTLESITSMHADYQLERNQQFTTLVDNINNATKMEYTIPNTYENILRDYQKEGYKWLKTMSCYGFSGILADDMGLGKTIQVLALLEDLKATKPNAISLVVCPTSLILNWQDEIMKFSKVLTSACIYGPITLRTAKITEMDINVTDIVITSYDFIRRDFELYKNITFDYVILDEAQYIKNHNTQNARSVKELKAIHRLALTGTPIENSLAELWSIFDFLMPNYLYNYHYFQNHFEKDIVRANDPNKQKKLKQLVNPFILRRTKKDVLKELPDKTENNVFLEFDEDEKKLYSANLAQANAELRKKLMSEENAKLFILALMTKLRQICCDPRLVYENIYAPSSKVIGCMDLIKRARESDQQVLLFSSFTSLLKLIEIELHNEKLIYGKITGENSKEERRDLVADFQNHKLPILLISLKAGGTGLNLTAAEVVIHFDPWWNLSAQNQATDRAHRIGQTKNLQVYKLIMKNSIEEKILELQSKKAILSDMFVETSDITISNMSKDELLKLFTDTSENK